jgi:hypothetical protein
MKKIIIAGIFALAFSVSASAQSKKEVVKSNKKEVVSMTPEQAAKKDGVAISEFLGLDETKTEDFIRLFIMKHQVMQDKSGTVDSRREMSRIVGLKIEASIDSKKLEKLKSNTELYNQAISADAIEVKK